MQRYSVPVDPDRTTGAARGASRGSAPPGLDRLRRGTWWSTVGLVSAAGLFVVVSVFATEPFGAAAAAVAAGAVVATVASARMLGRRLAAIRANRNGEASGIPVGLVVIAAIGAVVVVVAAQWTESGPAAWGVVPGIVAGGVAAPVGGRQRVAVVVGVASAAGAVAVTANAVATGAWAVSSNAAESVLAAVIGAGLVAGLWTWEVAHRLERARRLERELAVADERLRFAADLHDIQGHHLQVITRYSELAARLAETDPAAAAEKMRDVEEHARTALEETQAVVQGYREVTLGAELANATRVLAAAGIDARLVPGTRDAAEAIDETGRGLLGLVVREATTNMLAHSRADEATLALEASPQQARLQIVNDGATTTGGEQTTGTGLATLAQRLQAAGGTLDWSHDRKWFTVTARIPAARRPETP